MRPLKLPLAVFVLHAAAALGAFPAGSPAGKALMPAKRDLLAKRWEPCSAETGGFKTL